MKCFYHTDMDGKCAGAIVYWGQNPLNKRYELECIPINYKDDFPFDKIQRDEKVYIVDFSLQKDGDWEKLLAITKDIIWIDHHRTAIESAPKEIQDLSGIRLDGVAGCVLTWQYFNPNRNLPRIVELLGDYDIWAFKFGEDTNRLQAGIRLWETNPEHTNWSEWFKDYEDMHKEIEAGYCALRYRDNCYQSLIKGWSFRSEFEGYKAICCNAGSVSSQLFDSVKEDYDLMMPFVFDGKQWTVSLYTKKDIDVSEIAKKYGGGGHRQAAGFQCRKLPFKKI